MTLRSVRNRPVISCRFLRRHAYLSSEQVCVTNSLLLKMDNLPRCLSKPPRALSNTPHTTPPPLMNISIWILR